MNLYARCLEITCFLFLLIVLLSKRSSATSSDELPQEDFGTFKGHCDSVKPCEGRGLCLRGRCFCRGSYYGPRCQYQKGVSKPVQSANCNPACLNNGKCIGSFGDNKCKCRRHFTGPYCQYRYYEKVVCEEMIDERIECSQEGDRIYIDYAKYGRLSGDKVTCTGRGGILAQCGNPSEDIKKVRAVCTVRSCPLYASNGVYGDPCLRTPKYLFVRYHCQPEVRWTPWTEWSICSASCSGGKRSRRRSCRTMSGQLLPSVDCPRGQEADSLTKECNSFSCPKKASEFQWSEWNFWSSCVPMCGYGTQNRQRFCIEDGRRVSSISNCPLMSDIYQRRACTTSKCLAGERSSTASSGSAIVPTDDPLTEDSYFWSNWSPWSSCSASCGTGSQTRRKFCLARATQRVKSDTNCNTPAKSIIETQSCIFSVCTAPITTALSLTTAVPTRSPVQPPPPAAAAPSLPKVISELTVPGGRGMVLNKPAPVQLQQDSRYNGLSDAHCMTSTAAATIASNSKSSLYASGSFEDCADHCYTMVECRGITFDHNTKNSRCWIITEWCDQTTLIPTLGAQTTIRSYRKREPSGFNCGMNECDVDCKEQGRIVQCSRPKDRTILRFNTQHTLDSDCAQQCLKTNGCQSFEWGPSPTFYRLTYTRLNCALFNKPNCTGLRSSVRSRYCIRN